MLNATLARLVGSWRKFIQQQQPVTKNKFYRAEVISKGLQEVSSWIDKNCDMESSLTDDQLALIRQMAKMAIDRARYIDEDN